MKYVTTKEQTEELIKAGLCKEDIDIRFPYYVYSLSYLLEYIPESVIIDDRKYDMSITKFNTRYIITYETGTNYDEYYQFIEDDLVNVCVNTILWLKENKYI